MFDTTVTKRPPMPDCRGRIKLPPNARDDLGAWEDFIYISQANRGGELTISVQHIPMFIKALNNLLEDIKNEPT